jgi:hypothetical protein
MLTYDTRLAERPPIPADMQQAALDGMRRQAPMQFGQNAKDVYLSKSGVNAANYARAADMANQQYAVAHQNAQRGLALAGLQQMANEQQAANQYDNAVVSSVLGGLFR